MDFHISTFSRYLEKYFRANNMVLYFLLFQQLTPPRSVPRRMTILLMIWTGLGRSWRSLTKTPTGAPSSVQTFVIPNMGALALSFTLAMVDVLPTQVVIAISKGKIVREGGSAVQNFIAPRFDS